MKESTRILVALALAIVIGTLISVSGDSTFLRLADAVAPIGTVWVNAIRMTVIPLVVSLLVTSVASAADLSAVGRLGGRSLLVFLSLSAGVAIVMIPILVMIFRALPPNTAAPVLPANALDISAQVAASGQAATMSAWFMSLVPSNPIAAAANGAMLPLIVFTLCFALAVTNSGAESRGVLLDFFGAVSKAMLVLVRWILVAAPLGVFALALPLAAHAGASLAGSIGFYILAYSGCCVIAMALLAVVSSLVSGIPLRTFARAALPAQLIALTSSSSLASLPVLVESAEHGLGLPKRVTSFVLPLAVSMFKVAAPVSWTTGVLFVAWFYGRTFDASDIATIAFATVVLGFGVPGIPRGAFIMLTPLLATLGLPVEGIGLLIAVDVIPDTFATALNVTGDLSATAIVARGEPAGDARA